MRMELVVSCHYHQPHEYRHSGLAAGKENRFQQKETLSGKKWRVFSAASGNELICYCSEISKYIIGKN